MNHPAIRGPLKALADAALPPAGQINIIHTTLREENTFVDSWNNFNKIDLDYHYILSLATTFRND